MRNIRLIARRELRASSNQNRRVVIARAGMVLRVASLHWRRERGRHAMGPVFLLTGFRADRPLSVVLLMVAVAPIVTLTLIPLIAARLFVEEKQTRTIETLFTSPISDYEIILGKWLGAVSMYVLILALSLAELAAIRLFRSVDWSTVTPYYSALALQGCGVLAVGECLSMSTKH